jgi:hypothetical protein
VAGGVVTTTAAVNTTDAGKTIAYRKPLIMHDLARIEPVSLLAGAGH